MPTAVVAPAPSVTSVKASLHTGNAVPYRTLYSSTQTLHVTGDVQHPYPHTEVACTVRHLGRDLAPQSIIVKDSSYSMDIPVAVPAPADASARTFTVQCEATGQLQAALQSGTTHHSTTTHQHSYTSHTVRLIPTTQQRSLLQAPQSPRLKVRLTWAEFHTLRHALQSLGTLTTCTSTLRCYASWTTIRPGRPSAPTLMGQPSPWSTQSLCRGHEPLR